MSSAEATGQVIVITGASSGFGKGAALSFAHGGASLVLAARRVDLLEELAAECAAIGATALAVETDVGRQADVRRLAEQAVREFGRIDTWINDAGVGTLGRFEDVPLIDHVRTIETNLLGVLYGSYFAMRQFRRQQFGTLINIASVLGKVAAPYYASYTASKHGIVGLSAALRQEARHAGMKDIHICTVLPTAMDTPFFEHAANYTGHEAVPIPPVYDPHHVVDVIVRLASEPQDEVVVGAAGKIAVAAHGWMPGVIEAYLGRQTHRKQMEEAQPAAPTTGAIFTPSRLGTRVRGGNWIR